jgi:hypothetical protein
LVFFIGNEYPISHPCNLQLPQLNRGHQHAVDKVSSL